MYGCFPPQNPGQESGQKPCQKSDVEFKQSLQKMVEKKNIGIMCVHIGGLILTLAELDHTARNAEFKPAVANLRNSEGNMPNLKQHNSGLVR